MNMTPITLLLSTLAVGTLALPTLAQNDDLLVVEKRKDLAARTKMVNVLRKTRVTVNFEDATATEVARYLQIASGKSINIIVSSKTMKPEDMPKTTLALKSVSLANLMSVIEQQTGLRFTFNSGMIFLKPKAEVKAFAYLRMYDVRAAVFAVAEFIPPKLGLRPPDGEGGFASSEGEPSPVNGYDADKLVDLVRNNAVSESWDTEGISIDALNGILLVRQTVKGHRQVRQILEKMGAIPAVRRIVRRSRRVARPGPIKKAVRVPAKRAGKRPVKADKGSKK
jgi:hypothetical protein